MILVNASLKITRSPFRPAGRLAICLWLVAAAGQGDILPRLNRGESLKIAAIGTSLTAEAAERPNPWFDQMGAWLNTQYPGKVTLDNEAVQGAASQSTSTTYALGGLDQLTKALANNPDAIFIEFAMNDAVASFGISQQMSKDNLQTMIDRINAWAVKEHKSVDIVIQTMNNEGGGSSGSRPNLPSYYQGYRDVAKSNGLLLIDNYPQWSELLNNDPSTWRIYVPDGVHPTALGAEKVIMPVIKQALLSQVPEPRAVALVVTGIIFACFTFLLRPK